MLFRPHGKRELSQRLQLRQSRVTNSFDRFGAALMTFQLRPRKYELSINVGWQRTWLDVRACLQQPADEVID
jgi:hypothetical protein